jgi:hypothetical protein
MIHCPAILRRPMVRGNSSSLLSPFAPVPAQRIRAVTNATSMPAAMSISMISKTQESRDHEKNRSQVFLYASMPLEAAVGHRTSRYPGKHWRGVDPEPAERNRPKVPGRRSTGDDSCHAGAPRGGPNARGTLCTQRPPRRHATPASRSGAPPRASPTPVGRARSGPPWWRRTRRARRPQERPRSGTPASKDGRVSSAASLAVVTGDSLGVWRPMGSPPCSVRSRPNAEPNAWIESTRVVPPSRMPHGMRCRTTRTKCGPPLVSSDPSAQHRWRWDAWPVWRARQCSSKS